MECLQDILWFSLTTVSQRNWSVNVTWEWAYKLELPKKSGSHGNLVKTNQIYHNFPDTVIALDYFILLRLIFVVEVYSIQRKNL